MTTAPTTAPDHATPPGRTAPGPASGGAAALAARTWLLLAALGVLAAGTAGLSVGRDGAVSATVGVGLVAILFGVSVVLLRWTAARPQAALGVLLAGLGVRVVTYLLVLDAASGAAWLHGASLALATVAAFAITLVAELVWLARTPQLFLIDPAPRPRGESLDRTPELTP